METIKFYIKALSKEFTINFVTDSFMGVNVIVTSNLRPETYRTPQCFSHNHPTLRKEMRMVQYVLEDINNFVAALNKLAPNNLVPSKITEALTYVCREHINQCHRIWYADLLMYTDIYVYILGTIYPQYRVSITKIYEQVVSELECKFEAYVRRPPLFG